MYEIWIRLLKNIGVNLKSILGLVLDSDDYLDQTLETDLHISGVVLDLESLSSNSKKAVQVWIGSDGKNHLIANLCKQTSQFLLDIGLSKDEKVIFFKKGMGNVYFHGYLVPDQAR